MLYCINKKNTVRFYDEKAIKNDSINKRSPICLQSTKLLEKKLDEISPEVTMWNTTDEMMNMMKIPIPKN